MRNVDVRLLLITLLVFVVQETRADEFTPLIGFDEQLFPSYIISTATIKPPPADSESAAQSGRVEILGDRRGLLGVKLQSPGKNVPIKVTVSCDEVMDPSTYSGKLAEKGLTYSVYPKIRYHFTKLAEVTQAIPVSMTFKVQIGNGPVTEQTATVMLRPINDCPFLVYEGDVPRDISFTFAAYVNEQHPYLDKLLREALDFGMVDSFDGYQAKDKGNVIRQVYSIWDALVARDVRYSSITTTAAADGSVRSQHVRLLDQAINNAQANCVDGSVLLASALRKIGIEPFLVIVPGHCYLGFYLDRERKELFAIETTMLGRSFAEGESYKTYEELEDAVPEDLRDESSWPSFASAVVCGTDNFKADAEKFQSPEATEYLLIQIAVARKVGVLPIAFRGKEEFVSVDVAYADDEEEMSEVEDEEWSEDSEDEDSEDEDSEDEDSEDEDSEDEDSEGEDSEDEDSEGEDSEDEDCHVCVVM